MKISTRVIVGYTALVLLMVGGISYELLLIGRMRDINRRLAEVNLQVESHLLRLDEHRRNVDDSVFRLMTVGGDLYLELFQTNRGYFEMELRALADIVFEEQRQAVERLEFTWRGFVDAVADADAARPPSGYDDMPAIPAARLADLDRQLDDLQSDVAAARDAEIGLSIETSREAEQVSWIVALTALGLAGGVAFSVVRSIHGAFRRFMAATRSVAEGRFEQRLPEHRSDEFGELARSFNLMARRLEDLDRLKNDFVSSVSHDLKSPIASSREIVQLLLDEIPGPLNAEQRRLLELSIRSSKRLSSMVGGLLDLARIDAGTMTYELGDTDLAELVRETLEEFEVAVEDRGLALESNLDGPAIVRCDRDRIVQVFGNLIDNAMKFSTRGSTIRVSLEKKPAKSDESGQVLLSVIDSGPGVPDRDKRRIFGRFQQGRQEGAKYKGVGLGLAICWSIVGDHGGRIWVEDNPGGGSIFRFTLPASRVDAQSSERNLRVGGVT